MRGCITKKGSTYSIIVDLGRDKNGKRKQKWFNGFKTKKEAEKELAKVINQIDNKTFVNPDKVTLKEYLTRWFDDIVEPNLSQTTKDGYRYFVDGHIVPALGDILIQNLQPMHIQQFYKEQLENGRVDGKGGLSAKSVLNIHRILKRALAHAVKMQVVNRNAAEFVEVPKQKKYKASVLDETQVQNMLKVFKETNLYIPVLLAVGLGLRRGEALGLRWQDIDFESNSIAIIQTLLMTKGGIIFHDPKTETSKRVLIAPSTIMEELKKHKERQEEVIKIMGKAYQDNDLVSCYDDGHPFNPSTYSGLFGDILKRNKLPQIRFHDLRHTNATIMLKHNISAKVASERLGHSTIGITLDLYSHVLKEMQVEAANKIEKAIFIDEK